MNEENKMTESLAHPEAYRIGVADGYQDAIEKACEWLRSNLADAEYSSILTHFRKAMEE